MSTYTGFGALLRQDLRRDRLIAPIWILVMAVTTYASAAATSSLFSTREEQVRLAEEINAQGALRALYGPILDPSAPGELAMSKMTVLYALISTVPFVILVRRHTRVEEESGRAELIGATVVGRNAALGAAIAESAAWALLLGASVAVADIAGGLPVGGSVWFGVTWAGTGLVATATAALACQVSTSARTCAAWAAVLLGGAYVTRALGDAGNDDWAWLSWLSPLGWNTQLRAWSDPRPWVGLLYLLCSAALVGGAFVLRAHRDLGGGLISPRPGSREGRAWVAGPVGVQLRLHLTTLAAWTVAVSALGLVFGAMAPGLDDLLASSAGGEELVDRLGGAMISAILSVVAMVITAFPITVAARAAADEEEGRSELVLATAVPRVRWWAAVAVVAAVGSGWLLLCTGSGLALGYGLAGGSDPATSVAAAVAWAPAVVLVGGTALLAWSWRPDWVWVGWVALGAGVTLTLIGELVQLPSWVIELSPYSAVPQYPAEPWDWTPLVVLSLVAVGVLVAGFGLYRRRDVA